jgi:hypothetical protein
LTEHTPDTESRVRYLEQALDRETRAAEALRQELRQLRKELRRVEAGFKEQLEDAHRQRQKVEARFADQSVRLKALGSGREQTMRELQETRTELARVAADRDRLHKELAALSSWQTETVALPDDWEAPAGISPALPTLEELMANWSTLEDAAEIPSGRAGAPQKAGDSVQSAAALPPGPTPEMISPDLVFVPEDFCDEDQENFATPVRPPLAAGPAPKRERNACVLVFHDSDPPMKYPLFKEVMTIGRSEVADIRVEDDFISRIHARITLSESGALVEDAGSKNGIDVNCEHVTRRRLRHGDVLSVGKARFTFVDKAPGGSRGSSGD